MMTTAIESYYKDKITILKEKIESERFERTIAKQAQQKVSPLLVYFSGPFHNEKGTLGQQAEGG